MANKSKNGSALLTALFIMTMIAIAATAMSTRLHLDIFRTRMTLTSDKLYLASQAVTFWSMDYLSQKKNKHQSPSPLPYPGTLETIYSPAINVEGSLMDLQSKLNLNNLSDAKYASVFKNLLTLLFPEMNKKEKKRLITSIQEWINDYHPGRGKSESIEYYLNQKPPYQPGYQLFKSVSELRLISGVDAKIYNKLSSYVTALPTPTPININSASPLLIQALNNGLSESKIKSLKKQLVMEPVSSHQQLHKIIREYNLPSKILAYESHYYLSQSHVEASQLSLTNYTIIKRNKIRKKMVEVSIVWESLNTL